MSEGQRTGQRVHTPDISRIGVVCAWFLEYGRFLAIVAMEDDGSFMLIAGEDLRQVDHRVSDRPVDPMKRS